jgi:16S rRNA (uracil1498-N3)-methyltransferase
MHRYFLDEDFSRDRLRLAGTEAHHLIHVMRAGVGERVELFDGRGIVARGSVVKLDRSAAWIAVESRQTTSVPRGPVLMVAVPKGDRFRWLVEKATELGVARLIPITTQLSVVSPREGKLAKQEQAVIAACKQSGRNWLMPIEPLKPLPRAIDECDERHPKFVAHPRGARFDMNDWSKAEPPVIAVGPEGGFTDAELTLLESRGFARIGLGDSILRIETAAIAFAGWWCISHAGAGSARIGE